MIIRMLIDFLGRLRGPDPDDIGRLSAYVNRGQDVWVSVQWGECCTCGHEWERGELIGNVTQAYTRDGARSPGVRLACVSCVEEQRIYGDLSLRWIR